MPPRQPSLIDVARKAGVSISTVSRTISGGGRIGAETQERVRAAIAALGYRPNRVAKRLRSPAGGRELLGLIIPNIRNPFFADLARGVEHAAYARNVAVLMCNYDEDPAKERFALDVMRGESVDGTIIPPMSERDPALLAAIRGGMQVVCVDRSLSGVDVDKVEVDNRRGAFDAVAHLLARGYRAIALIGGPRASSTGRDRLKGFRDAHAAAGLKVDPRLIRHGDYQEESGRRLAGALLSLRRPPDAIFTCNNLMTVGALREIRQRGLKIPGDVALIGYDDLPFAELIDPPLTVVRQPAFDIGRTAAELVFRRVADPSRPAQSVRLSPELIVRHST